METPTLASMRLLPSEGCQAGAAFELQDQARESEVVTVDGWEVEVLRDTRLVVARGGAAVEYNTAVREGLRHVQMALDLMSIPGSGGYA